MSYSDFAEQMILALYQETERSGREFHKFGDLVDDYGIEAKELWFSRLADEWEGGFAKRINRVLNGYREWSVWISAAGSRYIEDKYGSKDGVGEVIRRQESDRVQQFEVDEGGTFLPAYSGFAIQDRPLKDHPQEPVRAHDSSSWTGLPAGFHLSAHVQSSLVSKLDQAEAEVAKLPIGQEAKAQARALILAARMLAEAPEPPADLIWEVISRANSISGVASLFVSIVALFLG